MNKKVLFTPYFLDNHNKKYLAFKQSDWVLNQGEPEEGETIQQRVIPFYKKIAEFVSQTAAEGQMPVSIAGDCCMSIPVLKGLQEADIQPTLLWLDAHGDFNTWETSPSGFLGGMPLAMMVGRGEQTWMDALDVALLAEDKVIFTDGRDLDPGELESLKNSQVEWVEDPADLLNRSLPDNLWVHFDVDVLNLADVPAVSYPAKGGPRKKLLKTVFQQIKASGNLTAVSVSLWNPDLDEDGLSQQNVLDLIDELLS